MCLFPSGTHRLVHRNHDWVRHFECLCFVLAIGLALPFLDQAFHVDDPNFLALAEHARGDPLALYDFTINWGGVDERAFDILANPPLVPWYLALVGSIAEGREWVYHLAFLPFLMVWLEGARRLGARFLPTPWGGWRGMVFAYASPALMVSSHTVMPDLPLLAAYGLGLAFALEGLDEKILAKAAFGAFLAGISALCRYSGMTVIPLLMLYILLHRVRWGDALAVIVFSMIPLGLWTFASLHEYDRIHWLAMAGFEGQSLNGAALLHKSLYQIEAMGLALVPAALLSLVVDGRRKKLLLWVSGCLGGCGLALSYLFEAPLIAAWLIVVGLMGGGLLVFIALSALSELTRSRLWRRMGGRSADSLFLSLWVLGVFIFNEWLLFASVRYLLPALLPAVLLVLRKRSAEGAPGWLEGGALVFGILLGLHLSWADRAFADGYRRYVQALPPIQGDRYFVGHWGLQYYMEKSGGIALSTETKIRPRPGDEIIRPTYAWPQDLPEGVDVALVERVDVDGPFGLRTFTVRGRGSFYADILAPGPTPVLIPYGFDSGPLESLSRWKVIQ